MCERGKGRKREREGIGFVRNGNELTSMIKFEHLSVGKDGEREREKEKEKRDGEREKEHRTTHLSPSVNAKTRINL